jgi:hypothetical protein
VAPFKGSCKRPAFANCYFGLSVNGAVYRVLQYSLSLDCNCNRQLQGDDWQIPPFSRIRSALKVHARVETKVFVFVFSRKLSLFLTEYDEKLRK